MKQERRILRNIIYAFAAQGISLLLSILTSLILPKFLTRRTMAIGHSFCFIQGIQAFSISDLMTEYILRLAE